MAQEKLTHLAPFYPLGLDANACKYFHLNPLGSYDIRDFCGRRYLDIIPKSFEKQFLQRSTNHLDRDPLQRLWILTRPSMSE
jgi:hypothetical protein